MNLEPLIKHLKWIVLFCLMLAGIYLLLKKLGVMA
jgi:hypothetical protein